MVRKGLIDKLYEAASMQRWNDHVRPVEFTELDKQAHKMVIAYVIAKLEEDAGRVVNWIKLIEGGIFELLQRVVLTDIKPPIYHKMMQEKGEQVNLYVFSELDAFLTTVGQGFGYRFRDYYSGPEADGVERQALNAAHYLATKWEFDIIFKTAPEMFGIDKTNKEIESRIKQHFDLESVVDIVHESKCYDFIDLCGQLRFQQRWAQSPRIPKTSVLGHMYIVAILAYLFSLEIGMGEKRKYNNFFCGLFHDLPEVLTRDIVSPVKKKTGIEELVKEYESVQVREKILPLLPEHWHGEINYFTSDEFSNRFWLDGQVEFGLPAEDLHEKYGADEFSPIDGELIRACDELAAFVEAAKSIEHGIRSHHLEGGKAYLYDEYRTRKVLGIDFGQIFDYFN
jgi:putative hydrolase of HD superfamily